MPVEIIPDIVDDGSESSQSYNVDFSRQYACEPSTSAFPSGKYDREGEGPCTECGMQTHDIQHDFLSQHQKVRLNVDQELRRGQCLLCFPIASEASLNRVDPSRQSKTCADDSTDTHWSRCSKRMKQTHHIVARRVSQSNMFKFNHSLDVNAEIEEIKIGGSYDIADILCAMKTAPHDHLIQELGCESLWILSWEDENASAIGCVGGIPMVLNAMIRFPMNSHLQQCACETIQNLALDEQNRREIVELGGISVIVKAMMRHMECAGIQQCVCTALASIATDPANRPLVADAGGYDAIAVAVRNFADNEPVARAAYDALAILGFPQCTSLGTWR
ncbi:predicted protein [Phaeodactylum tricornutum CCAP 1055/1]|uniref:LRRK2 ARM repeat domain-containing protein n=1 Tax=Phaeodactylum tricornutum (strain CCAP 1055/1) TaxID=556484 RepID=B7GB51_PHATC|nr:predicted protein [Phaeodactylum tricornutum CCAP 1055/1]EEC44059.1 predicted protein [Phaeodactylum tricornutum CCAP 1055/1]|eukprot:XP_002184310.1 predicted protein [Phaeodactylum tricornutum CCAP 1055/1]